MSIILRSMFVLFCLSLVCATLFGCGGGDPEDFPQGDEQGERVSTGDPCKTDRSLCK